MRTNSSKETKHPEKEKIEKERLAEVPDTIGLMREREERLKRRVLTDEEEEKEKLKEKLKEVALSKEAKIEALKEADKLREMQLEGQLRHLLDLAKTQSVALAVKTAEELNDPCLLDLLHDAIIEKGLYKKIE